MDFNFDSSGGLDGLSSPSYSDLPQAPNWEDYSTPNSPDAPAPTWSYHPQVPNWEDYSTPNSPNAPAPTWSDQQQAPNWQDYSAPQAEPMPQSAPITSSGAVTPPTQSIAQRIGSALGIGGSPATPAPRNTSHDQQEKSFFDGISGKDIVSILGMGALGKYNQNKAAQQGGNEQKQIQAVGQPFNKKAQEYMAAAESGNLLPHQQQQLQALRAQAQQNLFSRGQGSGIAAQQAEASIQQQSQNMSEQLMQQGLALANIGDQFTLQGIQAGYNADAKAQGIANDFYSMMFKVLGGQK